MRGVTLAGLAGLLCGGSAFAQRDAGGPPELNVPERRHVAVTRTVPAVRGRVDTVTFWAQSLGVTKRLLVWLPPSYQGQPQRRYPVAIYLHGLWGSETDWTTLGAIHTTLDSLTANGLPEFIVVMPDGDDGWYTTWNTLGDYPACRRDFQPRPGDTSADTYCVPWLHYDDYIARDVVSFIDRTWRTDARRERRVIGGLSMGGYGAITVALAYPQLFVAAASHSGVVSPLLDGSWTGAPRYAESAERLREGWGERMWPLIAPAFGPDTTAWWSRDPARLLQRAFANATVPLPAIFLDIGTEDGLIAQNQAFRHELRRLGVPHEYAEWPGRHDWPYWSRHVGESLRFFARVLQ